MIIIKSTRSISIKEYEAITGGLKHSELTVRGIVRGGFRNGNKFYYTGSVIFGCVEVTLEEMDNAR